MNNCPNHISKCVGAAPGDRTGQKLPLVRPNMSYQKDSPQKNPTLHGSWSTEVIFPGRRPPWSVGRDPDVLLKGATGSQYHLHSPSSPNRDSYGFRDFTKIFTPLFSPNRDSYELRDFTQIFTPSFSPNRNFDGFLDFTDIFTPLLYLIVTPTNLGILQKARIVVTVLTG